MAELNCRFLPEQIDPSAWIAPNATVLGNVTLGAAASVWFQAVVRGDTERILIGAGSNIQDGAVIHADVGLPCLIGARVTVGHSAIVHGALVEDEVMIGMGAIVLNGVSLGRGSIVGAGAVVPEGLYVPPNSLILGVPAKVIRPTTEKDWARIRHAAEHYIAAIEQYKRLQKN
jgi:carbonic anhydrase/acetyltransferase-like protein (isoleucine patch superfamily)